MVESSSLPETVPNPSSTPFAADQTSSLATLAVAAESTPASVAPSALTEEPASSSPCDAPLSFQQLFALVVDRVALHGDRGAFLEDILKALNYQGEERIVRFLVRNLDERKKWFVVVDRDPENEPASPFHLLQTVSTPHSRNLEDCQSRERKVNEDEVEPRTLFQDDQNEITPSRPSSADTRPPHQQHALTEKELQLQTQERMPLANESSNVTQSTKPSISLTEHTPLSNVHVTACPSLIHRALGVNPLEHALIPTLAWKILYILGHAGAHGVFQADLAALLPLKPSMVHHYIAFLDTQNLIAKRRVSVRTPKRQVRPHSKWSNAAVSGKETFICATAILVLKRYSAALQNSVPQSSTKLLDDTADERTKLVLDVLAVDSVRTERDLKFVVFPDSDRPADVDRFRFARRRHRVYRTVRQKLLKHKHVTVVWRKCVTASGKELGVYSCLKLNDKETQDEAKESKKSTNHPLLQNEGKGNFLSEVDIQQQVYEAVDKTGKLGIAVPEIRDYLDDKGFTAAVTKRVKTVIRSIARVHPIVERQHFEGSAMYMRVSFRGDEDASPRKRRKVGLTSLGERRQQLVMQLLHEKKVLATDLLGRQVAAMEKGTVDRVDPKVMRRILDDLMLQKKIKMIKTTRRATKGSGKLQVVTIVALPHIQEKGKEVSTLIDALLNRLVSPTDVPCPTNPGSREKEDANVGSENKQKTQIPKMGRLKEESLMAKHKVDESEVVIMQILDEVEAADNEEVDSQAVSKDDLETKRKRESPTEKASRPTKRKRSLKAKEANKNGSSNSISNKKVTLISENIERKQIRNDLRKAVDERNMCISKLRALDNGFLRGKMSRVRRLHQNMYDIVAVKEGSTNNSTTGPSSARISVSEAANVEHLAKFSMSWFLRELTVGEYAATIGLVLNHGDVIQTIEKQKICDVYDFVAEELESVYANRSVKQLLKVLTMLGLVQCDGESEWTLNGAAVLKDFGRGMPAGIIPHGIAFISKAAVNEYWKELEQFSQCRLSRKGRSIDLLSEGEKPKKTYEAPPENNLYFPMRWMTGLRQLNKRDQVLYEVLLQRLSGTDVPDSIGDEVPTENFKKEPLAWFSVEQLYDDAEKYICSRKNLILNQKLFLLEKFLLYSRYRNKNSIPKLFLQHDDEHGTLRKMKKRVDMIRDNTSILQLSRTPSAIFAYQARAGLPAVHTFHGKKPSNPMGRVKPREESRVEVKKLLPILEEVVKARARGYYLNQVEQLHWKRASNAVQRSLGAEKKGHGGVVETADLRRTVAALCEMHVVRIVLDVLSLKLVLTLRRSAERKCTGACTELSGGLVDITNEIVKGWACFNSAIIAILLEIKPDILKLANIVLLMDDLLRLSSELELRLKLEEECGFRAFRIGSDVEFPRKLAVMTKRYHLIADFRLRGNSHHPILLSTVQGQVQQVEARGFVPDDGNTDVGYADCERTTIDAVDEDSNTGSAGKQPETDGSVSWVVSSDNAPRQCGGIAELVILAICRGHPQHRWNEENRKLLSKFKHSDLADARDRLLLRGSIVYDGGSAQSGRGFLAARKRPKMVDRSGIPVLMDSTKEEQMEWMKGLTHHADDVFERTDLAKGTFGQSNENEKDMSTKALALLTTLVAGGQMHLEPELVNVADDEDMDEEMGDLGDEARVKLHFNFDWKRRGLTDILYMPFGRDGSEMENQMDMETGTGYINCKVSAEVEETCERIEVEVSKTGRLGMGLSELLERLNPGTSNEKRVIANGLHVLLERGELCRCAIEVDSEKMSLTDGIVYFCSEHSLGHSAWHNPDGTFDDQSFRDCGEVSLLKIIRDTGCNLTSVANYTACRHPGVPRRGVMDLLMVMREVVRVESCVKRGRDWNLVEDSGEFVDGVAVATWGEATRTATLAIAHTAHMFGGASERLWRRWRARLYV